MSDSATAKSVDDSTDVSVVKAALGKKKPPTETTTEVKTRRWIILSFWLVVALLGLPIWIWTTTVHRASLPLQSMNSWADGQACQLEFPLHVAIEAKALAQRDVQQLARLIQQTLDDHDEASLHHLRIAPVDQLDKTPAITVVINPGRVQEMTAKLQPYEPVLDVRHPPMQGPAHTSTLTPIAVFTATELRSLFQAEKSRLVHLLSNSGQSLTNQRINVKPNDNLDQRSTRAFKYASTYHLTFSLFSGAATPSAWDIESAMEEYLAPLLASFRSISKFTVDTQVQLYAGLSPSMHGPTLNEAKAQWTLQRADLSGFINAAEWPLSPSIGEGPTINFVLYVPSPKQSPLVIEETGGTSWLIPQWGGVQILNPSPTSEHSSLSKADLEPIMLAFADQLVSLLGLPQTPASLPLRLQSLTRERAASLILSASSTLGALSRLTLKLTSIAIPDNVADSVQSTIQHLESACADLREARYESALQNARIAEAEAEQAFFNPSMVGQVYFPDEHKVAVYVPLLGPMAVPLIMAAFKELKKLRQRQ